MPVLLTSMGTGSVGLSAPQRAAALKELCVSALGPQLFDLLYSVMHKRMAQVRGEALPRIRWWPSHEVALGAKA
jgi:hypothetical protein